MNKNIYPNTALTKREQQVYQLIIAGNSTKAIADILVVGYETIKTHRANIYKKFNVSGVVALISLHHQKLKD